MLIAILTGIFALIFTYLLTRNHYGDSAQLLESSAASRVSEIAIICGDCCGDAEKPVQTYLDASGNCAACGGRSYILAADDQGDVLLPALARMEGHKGKPGDIRLLAYKTPAPHVWSSAPARDPG